MENGSPQQSRLQVLKQRAQQQTEKLNRLELEHDTQSDIEQKIHLEQQIAATKQTLADIRTECVEIEIPVLIQEANRLKNIQNYHKAIALWHEIISLQSNYPSASYMLDELHMAQKHYNQAATLRFELASHATALEPIWDDLLAKLQQPSATAEFQTLLEATNKYCTKGMSASDFIAGYKREVQNAPAKQQTSNDLTGIARRIQQGDMVLFLGSDIAKHYDDECLNEPQIAQQLAQQIQYDDFDGSLTTIAEYYQAQAGTGGNNLLARLQQHLPKHQHGIQLYHHLANTTIPQVIITTVYDELLEQTFLAANKPFVKLSAFINDNDTDHYQVGHVHVHYSDQQQEDEILLKEALSAKNFIQQGYSIIYKMRGTCKQDSVKERDALVLTERQFFDLARHGQGIMPSNLSTEIRKRGFLFLGYRPRSWDDRLLVKILFEKHQNADNRCHVLTKTTDPLEIAHWKQHHVECYPFDLSDLDACLAGEESYE